MTKRSRLRRKRLSEIEVWLAHQRAERMRAAEVAATQRKPVDGLYPVELPSITDELDLIDFGGVSGRTPGRRVTPRDLPLEKT